MVEEIEGQSTSQHGTVAEVFRVFLKLGLTSFGGPVAHLGYFRDEFVVRRKWLDEHAYADLLALCQFLPGPASSQVGMSLGLSRAGYAGALAAWTAFTLPSAILMVLFAFSVDQLGPTLGSGWLHGLKVAAVAVVAVAVLGMARTLTPDRLRASFAVVAAALSLIVPNAASQIVAIALGALAGMVLLPREQSAPDAHLPLAIGRRTGAIALVAFFVLLGGLPLLALATHDHAVGLADVFYRSGALVFGGGHVVLPLLQAGVVQPGWISSDAFLAGYGAAQAVPGPLFTFAAYLGAAMNLSPNGVAGAALCLVAIFLPSFLLVIGVLPFWNQLRRHPLARTALQGINAAVVGLLLAALYDPVWTVGIGSGADFALAVADFVLLFMWRTPPWIVVMGSAIVGAAIASL
ncbi:MAG TPA: chromate efflux transporter [Devosiaceae bacterium]|nr:chromate efflux transporter [Devosiaceae bacterium]